MSRPEGQVLRLFELLEDLPVEGAEASFKMLRGQLLRNRLLWGIRTRELPPERLLEICERIAMPVPHLAALRGRLADANMVFFGFQETDETCVYRVYLEFWEKVQDELRRQPEHTAPVLLHLGFKWDASDNRKAAIAHYTYYPRLSVAECLSRLAMIYQGYAERTPQEVAEGIIRLAASRSRTAGDSLLYLEAAEGTSPRRSFDINLYKADLRLADIAPWVVQLREYYALGSEPFDSFYAAIGRHTLAHLSGGIDRQGHDFLTVYYEVDGL